MEIDENKYYDVCGTEVKDGDIVLVSPDTSNKLNVGTIINLASTKTLVGGLCVKYKSQTRWIHKANSGYFNRNIIKITSEQANRIKR